MINSPAARQISGSIFSDSKLFRKFPINPELKISVILPVRNEKDNLTKTLDALRMQIDEKGKRLRYELYEVLLLANNCTDNSVSVARAYQLKYPAFRLHIEDIDLPVPAAHIGTVRRLLMDGAYERFNVLHRDSGIIASTDSDSQVDSLWIYNTIKEIENGNDVVGGRILTRPEKSSFRLYYLRDITYKHLVSRFEDLLDPVTNDPWPRHFQCFGASFAVTCRVYDLCGRLPVIPFLEDMAFHKSLIRVDAKIRMSPLVKVFTSSRTEGRVDFGLSIQLKQWGEMNDCQHPLMVEPVGSLILKLKARRVLREFWRANRIGLAINEESVLSEICDMLQLDYSWLTSQTETAFYFGSLWEAIEEKLIENNWSSIWPHRNIVEVIEDLKREISSTSIRMRA